MSSLKMQKAFRNSWIFPILGIYSRAGETVCVKPKSSFLSLRESFQAGGMSWTNPYRSGKIFFSLPPKGLLSKMLNRCIRSQTDDEKKLFPLNFNFIDMPILRVSGTGNG